MPIRPEADDVISFLNELLALDPEFVKALCTTRFPCNDGILNHPSVQVCSGPSDGLPDGEHTAGFLGVLNGFLGTFGDGPRSSWGAVCMHTDDDTGAVLRFTRTENAEPAESVN